MAETSKKHIYFEETKIDAMYYKNVSLFLIHYL